MNFRKYDSYADYLKHQKSWPSHKSNELKFDNEEQKDWFRKWFKVLDGLFDIESLRAVCLGPKQGHEVEVLRDIGFDAVGIDLIGEPVTGGGPITIDVELSKFPLVIEGDFHDLALEDGSMDLVYSNALDHMYDMRKFGGESVRVLRRGGYLLYHVNSGQGCGSGFESMSVSNPEECVPEGVEVIRNEPLIPKRNALNHLLLMRKI